LKKIVAIIPSPRLRGEGWGEGLFAKNSRLGYFLRKITRIANNLA
jgi:hypothetical protein